MKNESKAYKIFMMVTGICMVALSFYCFSIANSILPKIYWAIIGILNIMSTMMWVYNVFGLTVDTDHMKYTWKHKIAFLKVEKQLTGKISIRGILHDVDKLFLYLFLDSEKVSKIHRKYSRHHDRARTEKDFIQVVIDWECARLTKEDKPLNAYETLYAYFPEKKGDILPLLERFGIARTRTGWIYIN